MTYKEKIDKLNRKVETIAQRGEDSYLEFIQFIDEIIENGQYSIFNDLMLTKYNINIQDKYKFIPDLKKNLFKEIRFQTKSKFQKRFSIFLSDKKVYTLGKHYYDIDTGKFLGDISEIEISKEIPGHFQNTRLSQKITKSDTYLETIVGLSSSIASAIPKFIVDGLNGSILYGTYSQVIYNNKVYECINSFTWTYTSSITPTYSNYFTLSFVPAYSIVSVTGSSSDTLLDIYSKAINLLRSYY